MSPRPPPDKRPPSLHGIDILEGLDEEVLKDLTRKCAWRTFAPGQRVISRDAHDRLVYLIVSGKVRVAVYAASGREVAYRDVPMGKCFGEIAAIDGKPRSANVEALETATIAIMPTATFWSLLERHPAVMGKVARLLTATIRSLSDRLFELSTLGVQNRVHAEILRLAREAGVEGNAARIEPAPRHVDIAAWVSTNREQVTKELSEMGRQGLVAKSGQALIVPDVARLERMVAAVLNSN